MHKFSHTGTTGLGDIVLKRLFTVVRCGVCRDVDFCSRSGNFRKYNAPSQQPSQPLKGNSGHGDPLLPWSGTACVVLCDGNSHHHRSEGCLYTKRRGIARRCPFSRPENSPNIPQLQPANHACFVSPPDLHLIINWQRMPSHYSLSLVTVKAVWWHLSRRRTSSRERPSASDLLAQYGILHCRVDITQAPRPAALRSHDRTCHFFKHDSPVLGRVHHKSFNDFGLACDSSCTHV